MGEPELPYRKVIIDSRNAVVGDSENFVVALPSTLQLPPNTACYVLDVALTFGFYTVEAGYNDRLYFLERMYDGSSDVTRVATATLPAGSYTSGGLAAAIQIAINAESQFAAAYTCSYESITNTILISVTFTSAHALFGNYHGFTLLSRKMLENPGVQSRIIAHQTFSFNNLRDASGLLSLDTNSAGSFNDVASLLYAWDNPTSQGSFPKTLQSGHVDVRGRQVIYLHSDALAGMRTIGPNGSRSVISRLPVSTTFGGMVTREHSSHPLDYIPVGGRTLTSLDISIRDSFGDIVPLHGSHLSFELLFAPEPVA